MSATLPNMTATSTGTRLDIRVVPRAKRARIDGVRDGRLLVRVTAAPVDGAANEAALHTLADALDVPRRSLRLVSGETSRNKIVEVASVDVATMRSRLER